MQVLFAFLLVVPFNQRWVSVTKFQEKIYQTLLCAAAASAFLIAPSVQHRIEFRRQDKGYIVTVGNRMAIIGLGFLAVAMTGAILLVTDVIFGTTTTLLACAAVAVMFVVLWGSSLFGGGSAPGTDLRPTIGFRTQVSTTRAIVVSDW